MKKNRLVLVVGLLVLLGLITAMSLLASRTSSSVVSTPGVEGAQVSTPGVEGDQDLMPAANMKLDPNFKAQPASGSAVNLPWANVKVNNDNSIEAQNEPFAVVDPNNPQHLVIGAISWQSGDGHFVVYAYVSFDGGSTWASSQPYIDRNANRLDAADPTVAFGSDGSVYFAFVAKTPADGAVAVSRSNDGGLTWTSQQWATSFNTGADKPAIAAGNGKLYLYYQNDYLNATVSADGGATWSSASTIELNGRDAAPVIDNAGNVNLFYNNSNSIKLARLAAGAKSYTISTVAKTVPLQPRAARYRAGIYPAAGADAAGNLYVAWADGRNAGRGNDILISSSVNGGQSWTAPTVVNSDATSADQLMPALTVSSDGMVTVAWLDNRNDPANVNYDVYIARSKGTANFNNNLRVTTISSNPNNDPRTQGTLIGDYFALAAGNGTVYPVWTDTRNNNEDIYLAPITLSTFTGR